MVELHIMKVGIAASIKGQGRLDLVQRLFFLLARNIPSSHLASHLRSDQLSLQDFVAWKVDSLSRISFTAILRFCDAASSTSDSFDRSGAQSFVRGSKLHLQANLLCELVLLTNGSLIPVMFKIVRLPRPTAVSLEAQVVH